MSEKSHVVVIDDGKESSRQQSPITMAAVIARRKLSVSSTKSDRSSTMRSRTDSLKSLAPPPQSMDVGKPSKVVPQKPESKMPEPKIPEPKRPRMDSSTLSVPLQSPDSLATSSVAQRTRAGSLNPEVVGAERRRKDSSAIVQLSRTASSSSLLALPAPAAAVQRPRTDSTSSFALPPARSRTDSSSSFALPTSAGGVAVLVQRPRTDSSSSFASPTPAGGVAVLMQRPRTDSSSSSALPTPAGGVAVLVQRPRTDSSSSSALPTPAGGVAVLVQRPRTDSSSSFTLPTPVAAAATQRPRSDSSSSFALATPAAAAATQRPRSDSLNSFALPLAQLPPIQLPETRSSPALLAVQRLRMDSLTLNPPLAPQLLLAVASSLNLNPSLAGASLTSNSPSAPLPLSVDASSLNLNPPLAALPRLFRADSLIPNPILLPPTSLSRTDSTSSSHSGVVQTRGSILKGPSRPKTESFTNISATTTTAVATSSLTTTRQRKVSFAAMRSLDEEVARRQSGSMDINDSSLAAVVAAGTAAAAAARPRFGSTDETVARTRFGSFDEVAAAATRPHLGSLDEGNNNNNARPHLGSMDEPSSPAFAISTSYAMLTTTPRLGSMDDDDHSAAPRPRHDSMGSIMLEALPETQQLLTFPSLPQSHGIPDEYINRAQTKQRKTTNDDLYFHDVRGLRALSTSDHDDNYFVDGEFYPKLRVRSDSAASDFIPAYRFHQQQEHEQVPGGAFVLEARRERIERFLRKRARRVWTPQVTYESRKRSADHRQRVGGRFVATPRAESTLNGAVPPPAPPPLPLLDGPIEEAAMETNDMTAETTTETTTEMTTETAMKAPKPPKKKRIKRPNGTRGTGNNLLLFLHSFKGEIVRKRQSIAAEVAVAAPEYDDQNNAMASPRLLSLNAMMISGESASGAAVVTVSPREQDEMAGENQEQQPTPMFAVAGGGYQQQQPTPMFAPGEYLQHQTGYHQLPPTPIFSAGDYQQQAATPMFAAGEYLPQPTPMLSAAGGYQQLPPTPMFTAVASATPMFGAGDLTTSAADVTATPMFAAASTTSATVDMSNGPPVDDAKQDGMSHGNYSPPPPSTQTRFVGPFSPFPAHPAEGLVLSSAVLELPPPLMVVEEVILVNDRGPLIDWDRDDGYIFAKKRKRRVKHVRVLVDEIPAQNVYEPLRDVVEESQMPTTPLPGADSQESGFYGDESSQEQTQTQTQTQQSYDDEDEVRLNEEFVVLNEGYSRNKVMGAPPLMLSKKHSVGSGLVGITLPPTPTFTSAMATTPIMSASTLMFSSSAPMYHTTPMFGSTTPMATSSETPILSLTTPFLGASSATSAGMVPITPLGNYDEGAATANDDVAPF